MQTNAALPRRTRRWVAWLALLSALIIGLVLAYPALRRVHDIAVIVRQHPALPYPVPVEGIRPRQLTDSWGAARSGNRRHQGIDIFARCGTPIHSATDGIIFTVGTNSLGGQIVRVLGPGGFWHYYAHLSRFADVREGQRVAVGTVLGYVGDTGNAKGTPCHLHYGVYSWANVAQNPFPLLTDSLSRPARPRAGR